jgi:hypothetical protein
VLPAAICFDGWFRHFAAVARIRHTSDVHAPAIYLIF